MKAATHKDKSSGFVLTEAVVSIALLALLLTMVSLLMVGYERATDSMLNIRRAQWVAETQIERMRAGLSPVTDRSFEPMDGVVFDVSVSDGEGDWQGMRRVVVRVSVTGKHGRVARHTTRAYLRPPSTRAGGES